jgi:tRNA(Leu) C34 or U34 (ribose-2'-O)-methylase TrmL
MFDKVFSEVEIKSAHGESLYQDDLYLAHDGQSIVHQEVVDIQNATSNRVDGAALLEFNERKGFYRERAHGREVEVGNIQVDPTANGKYKMTAVINGQTISHEITQKQYDKFLAVDDYHRMQLFSKIFNEVDIKTRPGEGHNLGAALLAALVVGGEDSGVKRLTKEKCDKILSIPLQGQVNSLNASVALGIAAYEVVRNRL